MELQELKNIWQSHDEQLDNNVQVNRQLLENVSLNKVKSLLTEFKVTSIIEFIFDLMASLFLISFMVRHFSSDWSFVLPAGILLLFCLLDFKWHISRFIALYNINYKSNILETQKHIEELRWNETQAHQHLYIAIPLFFPLFVLVIFKGLFNIDLYPYLWTWYGLSYFLGSLVVTIIIVWFLKNYPDKKMEEAARFLEEIEDFKGG